MQHASTPVESYVPKSVFFKSILIIPRQRCDNDASADAFGNALGNSIVRQSVQSQNDRIAEQERLSAAIGAIGQDAVSGLDEATNQRINELSNQTATNLSAQASRVTNALARNNAIDADASFVAMEAARTGRSQQVIDSFYDTANAAYQRTVSGISAGLAAGNAVRERLAGVTEASVARRQAGNALAASQFDSIGGSGFDVGQFYADNNVLENQRVTNHYLNAEKRYSLDDGQTNAIEIEIGGDFDFFFFGGSAHFAIGFDNQGGFTAARGFNFRGSTNGEIGFSAFGTVLKGHGTTSQALVAGTSETQFHRLSLADTAETVFGNTGATLFKGRDLGVFSENGFTLDDFGNPEFVVEGFGLDVDVSNRFTNGIDDFNNKLLLGREPKLPFGYQFGAERESAVSLTGDRPIETGVLGQSVFGFVNRLVFK